MSKIYILIHLVQSNQTVRLLPRGLYQKQLSKLAFWQVQPSQIGSQENGQPKQYLGPPGWEFGTLAILDRTKVETKLQLGQIFLKYYLVWKHWQDCRNAFSTPSPYSLLFGKTDHRFFWGGEGGKATLLRGRGGKNCCGKWFSWSKFSYIVGFVLANSSLMPPQLLSRTTGCP